jgi:hypothetical protein
MAEQLAATSQAFYLRFRPAEERKWVRRNLFAVELGWSPCWRMEEATAFSSRVEAAAFAAKYHLERDVELLVVSAEEVHVV